MFISYFLLIQVAPRTPSPFGPGSVQSCESVHPAELLLVFFERN